MASIEQIVTTAPTALAGIAEGTRYFLQNSRGRRDILRVAVKPSGTNVGPGRCRIRVAVRRW